MDHAVKGFMRSRTLSSSAPAIDWRPVKEPTTLAIRLKLRDKQRRIYKLMGMAQPSAKEEMQLVWAAAQDWPRSELYLDLVIGSYK